MEIKTTRFGTIEIEEDKIIHFTQGILGFPKERSYVLFPHKDSKIFFWLQSIERPELAFVCIDPFLIRPDYEFVIPDRVEKELDIKEPSDVNIITLVTIPNRSDKEEIITVNLLGPIVVNARTRLARQIVLDPNKYQVNYPIGILPPLKQSQKHNLEKQAAQCP